MIGQKLAPLLLACAAVLALAVPAQASREIGDGTTADGWVLGNGLRVVVRDIRGADAVAIIVAYASGRDDDPAGQEGLTALMAEVAFTAAAGESPARTPEELDSQRPAGWNVQVERRRTEFAELATPQQFPGVLHQVAERMQGVRVTDAAVDRARAALIERRARSIGSDPVSEMYVELGQVAAGWDHARMKRWMTGEGLQAVRARDLGNRIAEAYVPARAVLSLAGDFTDMNLRAFVEREFGGIPAGEPRVDAVPAGPRVGVADFILHPGLDQAVGGVGIAAPALTDSLHPFFYLTALVLGTHANTRWNEPGQPPTSRFQYSILDDPDVVRLYPPLAGRNWSPELMVMQMNALMSAFDNLTIELDQVRRLRDGVQWLLGGPMQKALAIRIRTDRSVLYRMGSAMATRELWGGEAFWNEYRRRFDPEAGPSDAWTEYFRDPRNAILLIYRPESGEH